MRCLQSPQILSAVCGSDAAHALDSTVYHDASVHCHVSHTTPWSHLICAITDVVLVLTLKDVVHDNAAQQAIFFTIPGSLQNSPPRSSAGDAGVHGMCNAGRPSLQTQAATAAEQLLAMMDAESRAMHTGSW